MALGPCAASASPMCRRIWLPIPVGPPGRSRPSWRGRAVRRARRRHRLWWRLLRHRQCGRARSAGRARAGRRAAPRGAAITEVCAAITRRRTRPTRTSASSTARSSSTWTRATHPTARHATRTFATRRSSPRRKLTVALRLRHERHPGPAPCARPHQGRPGDRQRRHHRGTLPGPCRGRDGTWPLPQQ